MLSVLIMPIYSKCLIMLNVNILSVAIMPSMLSTVKLGIAYAERHS